jgi:hypothetical protein
VTASVPENNRKVQKIRLQPTTRQRRRAQRTLDAWYHGTEHGPTDPYSARRSSSDFER